MTLAIFSSRRATVLLALLALAAARPCPADQRDWSLAILLRELAAVPAIDAQFRETKWLQVLDRPMRLTGVLRYRRPDYLKRQLVLPQRELIEVSGERLRLESAERGQIELDLRDYPEIAAFVAVFRATLAGDGEQLAELFEVDFGGPAEAWQLRLKPRQNRLAEVLDSVLISGRKARLTEIDIRDADGDRSLMTLYPSGPGSE